MALLLFLHKIVQVFTEYFRELEEESLRDNFVLVYELLDEMMDFGHPQTSETKILKECVNHNLLFLYNNIVVGTLRSKASNWNRDLSRHPPPSLVSYRGVQRASDIAKMKYIWT